MEHDLLDVMLIFFGSWRYRVLNDNSMFDIYIYLPIILIIFNLLNLFKIIY